jgi:hypothetical protein
MTVFNVYRAEGRRLFLVWQGEAAHAPGAQLAAYEARPDLRTQPLSVRSADRDPYEGSPRVTMETLGTSAYRTEASRAAVRGIAAILAMLPLNLRADVVEEAFGAGLPEAWADKFREEYGNEPMPVLLIGGEIASDVIDLYEADDAQVTP